MSEPKRTTKYLHTIERFPAYFDGNQICFCRKRRVFTLADSLKQIRMEQKKTRQYREDNGWEPFNYDYQIVKI